MNNNSQEKCILDDTKLCNDCGECDFCDLDAAKPCTNCCRCLDEPDYRGIEITEIVMPDKLTFKRKKRP